MKPFPEAILSGLAATVFLLLTTNVALGQLPSSNKAISQKFMKEVAAHVAASDTILKRNDLKATRDHSVWINGLNEQADKLFGDTVFACTNAFKPS